MMYMYDVIYAMRMRCIRNKSAGGHQEMLGGTPQAPVIKKRYVRSIYRRYVMFPRCFSPS